MPRDHGVVGVLALLIGFARAQICSETKIGNADVENFGVPGVCAIKPTFYCDDRAAINYDESLCKHMGKVAVAGVGV